MTSATRNACKLCSPLGACIAFRGIKGAMPLLHGSQGCATYIRRYIISHFREPMDIASSSFSEEAVIFGGRDNLYAGIKNVSSQYAPSLIGVATTCLSETIGDDVSAFLRQYRQNSDAGSMPLLVNVSTPSYRGSHIDGFQETVKSVVESLARKDAAKRQINLFSGFVSCADIRYLKEILQDFNLQYVLFPDYSDTLDAGLWDEYKKIPEGGTPVEKIMDMGSSCASIEFGKSLNKRDTAAAFLLEQLKVSLYNLGLPIGINETDKFFKVLQDLSGAAIPERHKLERGRLIDSYVDGHKYVFGKRAIVYGEEDLVCGIAAFLSEIGVNPVLCASGQKMDFAQTAEEAEKLSPDFLIGNSKGYFIARKLKIPLVRIGFPIHDRIGAQRILHLGYRGAQELFDRIVNALITAKQDASDAGYSYA